MVRHSVLSLRRSRGGKQGLCALAHEIGVDTGFVDFGVERLEDLAQDFWGRALLDGLCDCGCSYDFGEGAVDVGLREEWREEGVEDGGFLLFLLCEVCARGFDKLCRCVVLGT